MKTQAKEDCVMSIELSILRMAIVRIYFLCPFKISVCGKSMSVYPGLFNVILPVFRKGSESEKVEIKFPSGR